MTLLHVSGDHLKCQNQTVMTYMNMSYAESLATEIRVYIQKILAWLKGVACQPSGGQGANSSPSHGMWDMVQPHHNLASL